MSKSLLLKNLRIVNEGKIINSDLLIKNNRIEKIATDISVANADVMDANGLYLIPGCIDDQVHFREPGYTYKANIHSESAAAVAGGITSFMEMPNTFPNALTLDLLEQKYDIAAKTSFANYSFYMGSSNDNIEEILKIDKTRVCGVKIFMGSSTGNMLVDNEKTLNDIFSKSDALIAVHCEDEQTVKHNLKEAKKRFPNGIPARYHPVIRSREACLKSSSRAVSIATKYQTRLHILHITTAEEIKLFTNTIDLKSKRITSEACVHHLYFSDQDYELLANQIKCNPAIKTIDDRNAIRQAVADGYIDVIATDHAPHTWEEKSQDYLNAPSGLPLIQQSLQLGLSIAKESNWSLPFLVKKMSHDVADCFNIIDRGYVRESYFADLVLFDPDAESLIRNEDVYYKCGWTPLHLRKLPGRIHKTFVNGQLAYDGIQAPSLSAGQRMAFKS